LAPSPDDVRNERKFSFAADLTDNSWFLLEEWVQGWLSEIFDRALKAERIAVPRRQDGERAECAYWSCYAVLIAGLQELLTAKTVFAPLPAVRFLDVFSDIQTYSTNEVDLVLDIGNSRTCGVLIESGSHAELNLAKSAIELELRDLSRPERGYREPFRSRCEFSKPDFGLEFWSRMSGRLHAFKWASFVRVGPEALRLNSKSSGAEGDTGLSGPKRYLWDERENRQQWYFNVADSTQSFQTPVVGEIMEHVSNLGDLLDFAGPDVRQALQPKFSRASMFTFMVMELILQAIAQINAPDTRHRLGSPNVPRRLRSVVLTIPTGTPVLERKRYQMRCKAAVDLVWRTFGWSAGVRGPSPPPEAPPGAPPPPEVVIAYDEATCTQILYLYSEIAEKFRRSPADFFELIGRKKDGGSADLRVASIDIGGGTTDLMIVTYDAVKGSPTLLPRQNFREGFRKAGDDILEAVVTHVVVPALEQTLKEAGVGDPRRLVLDMMGDAEKDAMQRQRRMLFVSQVLVPIALCLIERYEAAPQTGETQTAIALASVFSGPQAAEIRIMDVFDGLARAAGAASGFSLRAATVRQDFAALAKTVAAAIEQILAVMCEVVNRFDCDLLLMTGRPSRLPVVRDLILRNMAVPPHRVVFMHGYKVSDWYPFAGQDGTIQDPKTTVVVGALLCTLAERRKLEGFGLNEGGLRLESTTANYIGRMERDNTIKTDSVLFAPDGGGRQAKPATLKVEGPMFIGFRQLPIERWPGTPLFFLEINGEKVPPAKVAATIPWTLTLRRGEDDDAPAGSRPLDETLVVDTILNRDNDDVPRDWLTLRLQTMRQADGYWLDTGVVTLI
ncbi:MAG: virulence factor SrfB, partial [Hyphomicrobiaceae bacterium]